MCHVVAALQSFQLISLIPHHLPKMIGFSGSNRVDMDQFSRDAAYIGAGGALTTIGRGVSPDNIALAGRNNQNQLQSSSQKAIGYSPTGKSSNSTASNGQIGYTDTTLQATTDVSGSRPTEEA